MSNRKKQKTNIFGSLLVGFLVVMGLFFYFGNTKAKASWFDDAWRYRVAVPISAHTTAETNVYITLSGADGINTTDAAKFQADCGDIRFVNESGDLLPYYLTTACGLAQTGFQVYFESFPAGAQTIYYYYGNPSASNGFSGASMGAAATGVTLGTRGSETEAPSSPMVYFRLDEGTGQTVANSMETVNNGTLGPDVTVTGTDPTWRVESLCMVGNCLEFESTSSQYVNVANTIGSVNTVSFWVKPTSTTTSLMVLNGAAGNASISVSSGTISAGAGFSSPTIYVNGKASSALVANEWQYVTVTTATGISASNIMIGRVNTGYLDGFVDEVKLFGSVIPVSQIKAGYASGLAKSSSTKNSSVSFGGGGAAGTLTNGLVGYWKMDEAASPAVDSSGNGNSGTWNGNVAAVTGKYGPGISLDGTTDYLNIGSPSVLDNLSQLSLSTWVYPNSDAGRVIDKQLNDNTTGWKVEISSTGDIQFTVDYDGATDLQVDANSNLSSATWHHVFISWDGTSDAAGVKIIVDGVLQTSFNINTSGVGNRVDDNAMSIGVGCRISGTNQCTSGRMDEMRIYNRALSDFEGNELFRFAPGPVGYWKLDENTGTTANDSSGNGLVGTLGGTGIMPTWNSGRYGSGVRFYPTSDSKVSAADNAILRPNTITVESWINVNTVAPTYQSILDKGWNAAGAWSLYIESGTDFWFSLKNSAGTQYDAAFTMTIVPNTWYHVAGVFDGTSVSIYVNGVKGDFSSVVSGTGFLSSTDNFTISQAGTNVLNGVADDVKVYNYARTVNQIIEDMNAGNIKAVSYWKMDEGSGTTAYDSNRDIGGSENLTLSTATSSWSNSGKYGKAFSAGGSRWLTRSDDPYLDFANSESFSISFWMKSSIASAANPSATEYIVNKPPSGATNGGYAVYANTSGQVCLGIDDDNTSFPEDSSCTASDVYDNTWHHIVAVKTGASSIMVYVDAVPSGTPDVSISASVNTLANTSTFYVGSANAVNDTDDFSGDLDEMQIFRGAITADQVKVLYGGNSQAILGATSVSSTGVVDMSSAGEYCVPGDTASCLPPVAHWKMDENTGIAANDSSGNGNTGTITAGVGGFSSGKIGSSYDYDGLNTIINAGSGTSLDNLPTAGMSVSAWIFPRSRGLNNVGSIVFKNNGFNANAGWYFRLGGTYGLNFTVDGSTDLSVVTNNNVVVQNVWNHVELSWDGVITTAASAHIYVNGVEVGYLTQTNGAARVDDGASNLYIGNDSSVSRTFDGKIDDVKVYNYARTPAQIAWDYNQGKPVAWWKMDECRGTSVNDSMGNVAVGTISFGATGNTAVGTCGSGTATEMWNDGTTGRRNSGLGFDSTDDAVSFGADSRLYLTKGGSIAAWIKPNSTGEGSFGRIIDKSSDTSGTGGYGFQMDSGSNQFYGEIAGSTCVSNPNAITMSTWNHVVWTFDGTNWKLYSNGILNKTCVNPNLPPNTSLGVSIGNRQGATDRTFDGLIDDVRIYNYPLTAAQVKTVANEGSAVRFGQ